MHIIVGPTTTCTEVVRKVLQKCRVSDPVPKYQLSVTAKGEDKGMPQGVVAARAAFPFSATN